VKVHVQRCLSSSHGLVFEAALRTDLALEQLPLSASGVSPLCLNLPFRLRFSKTVLSERWSRSYEQRVRWKNISRGYCDNLALT
jgi:hypothetical protein